jgi:hypothetical protein
MMRNDSHEAIRRIIDESLVSEVLPQDAESVRMHVGACGECRAYMESCTRTVAALGGFSFAEDPMLRAKVMASLGRRAEELEGRRLIWARCLIAVMLTVAGSFAAVQIGGWIGGILHVEPAQVRAGLIAVWIVPSLLICVLLPVLPVLSGGWMGRRG